MLENAKLVIIHLIKIIQIFLQWNKIQRYLQEKSCCQVTLIYYVPIKVCWLVLKQRFVFTLVRIATFQSSALCVHLPTANDWFLLLAFTLTVISMYLLTQLMVLWGGGCGNSPLGSWNLQKVGLQSFNQMLVSIWRQ